MQKFIIPCIIRISNFTAGVTASVRLAAVLDRSVYLIPLAHPIRILARLRCRLVKFDTVGGPVMAVYTGRDHRGDGQRNCWHDQHAEQS